MTNRLRRTVEVTRLGAWDVSDNGESVVAFGPNHEQAPFVWGTTRAEAAAVVAALGPEEFTRQIRAIARAQEQNDDYSRTYAVSEFTLPPTDGEASPE